MTTIQGIGLAAGLAALTMTATTASADQLRFAIGHPPASFLVKAGETMAKTMAAETGDAVTIKVFPMSLLSMAETSGGLRDGLADIGTVMSTYFPAEFPHTNLLLEASMMLSTLPEDPTGVEAQAYSAAMAEYILTKCPECNAEFAKQNQVYTAAAGTPGYALNCTKPVVTMDDLKGARLRIGGANWAGWSEAVGAAPVTMSGNEMLEALSQGVLDCIILSVPDVQNFGMGESVKHITMGAPGGVYVASMAQVNRDAWQDLSPEARTALLKAAALGSAEASLAYENNQADILEKVKAKGVQVHQADPAVVEATRSFVEGYLKAMPATYQQRYGVTRGEEILTDFRTILIKWVGLARTAKTREDLARLYWDEIYSKVDVNTHGM
ncbi:C4-dicarboxylate TRAP transporter substrate-binding protein [uncultured Tistrella sp.]|uniref:C4-dicarboxylate TRAP transporter substrate-binding protein n=1 Tax=Tistrella mobilis TaxID=171437 RepID=UPI000C090306|nr:C4-dicarboxylate TRAP transporter substrate-binding protein [uncultured Tistrella sp.]MAM72909.1 C4-dicarboxylate ABC transporter substrate-binding protein [Tistrella sp.]